jgi:hypothetical protein
VNEDTQDVICVKDYYDLKDKNAFHFEKYAKDHAHSKDSDMENQNEEGDQEFEAGSEGKTNGNGKRVRDVEAETGPHKKMSTQSYQRDPHIVSNAIFLPYFKPEYNLQYGTQFFYVFFKQFYSIYERLLKAKDLVASKVDED